MKMKTCQFHKNKALLHYYPKKVNDIRFLRKLETYIFTKYRL